MHPKHVVVAAHSDRVFTGRLIPTSIAGTSIPHMRHAAVGSGHYGYAAIHYQLVLS